jgi:hypothetical protein
MTRYIVHRFLSARDDKGTLTAAFANREDAEKFIERMKGGSNSLEYRITQVELPEPPKPTISYVDTDEDCLGFIEQIDERQWRAVGTLRGSSGCIWIFDIGTFPTPEQARDAIRMKAIQHSGTPSRN